MHARVQVTRMLGAGGGPGAEDLPEQLLGKVEGMLEVSGLRVCFGGGVGWGGVSIIFLVLVFGGGGGGAEGEGWGWGRGLLS